ncbi:putative RNA methyltransferase [Shewanella violacea]|uniref:Ribosomal RNA large subunit methyltransferase A, putative n=1 Tax=Shewanella violacea (strain JCM 10179 / CIP 106290 / LMG 19151 / DSS12) TaxID=637905 RepID=D4ZGQ9_SHEVD|nr:SAM-dependent methyltransferase [Shewanella violacea]BAJ00858.1 ribosomal RNA large subunit methyltransferase A, putative [Shewanella violacea DSS12]
MKSIYLCPVCNQPLLIHEESQGLHCSNKHHFDKSDKGYWVFSLPKKPKLDSRQVMRGKRFLLESGVFSPLVDTLAEMLKPELAHIASDEAIAHLEYDCGEGYYLRAIKSALSEPLQQAGIKLEQHGINEAENALFSAAKIDSEADSDNATGSDSGTASDASSDSSNESASDSSANTEAEEKSTLIVSSLRALPFADASFDLITLIDKQLKGKEPLRVLKQAGYLLQVSPAPRHLWQLKGYIYPDMKEKELQSSEVNGLELLDTQRVTFKLDADGEQALTLLEMTPYAWRANDKIRKKIASGNFEGLEIDFIVTLSKKI